MGNVFKNWTSVGLCGLIGVSTAMAAPWERVTDPCFLRAAPIVVNGPEEILLEGALACDLQSYLEAFESPEVLAVFENGRYLLLRTESEAGVQEILWVDRESETEPHSIAIHQPDAVGSLDPLDGYEHWRLASPDRRSFAFYASLWDETVGSTEAAFWLLQVDAPEVSLQAVAKGERLGWERDLERIVAVGEAGVLTHYGMDESDDWKEYFRWMPNSMNPVSTTEIPYYHEYLVSSQLSREPKVFGYGFMEDSRFQNYYSFDPREGAFSSLDGRVFAESDGVLLRSVGDWSDAEWNSEWRNGKKLVLEFPNGTVAELELPEVHSEMGFEPNDAVMLPEMIDPEMQWIVGRVSYFNEAYFYERTDRFSEDVLWGLDGRVISLDAILPEAVAANYLTEASIPLDLLVINDRHGNGDYFLLDLSAEGSFQREYFGIWPLVSYPHGENGWRYIHDGLGWVYTARWPWVFHSGIGEWSYVAWPQASLESMWLYRANAGDWVWTNSYWGGWSYLKGEERWINFNAQ